LEPGAAVALDDRWFLRDRRRGPPHALQLIWLAAGCGGRTPDGTILWVAERSGHAEVWSAAGDGSGAHRLADLPGSSFPAAPDPQARDALVVVSEDDARGHSERMWLVPLDGGAAAPFGPRSARIRNPAWSATGDAVYFESDLESYRDLYLLGRGGALHRVTEAPNGSFEPAVSASRLAFGTSRDGNAEIYASALDGTSPVRLTDDPGDDVHPGWRPDGLRLAWIAHRVGVARAWTMAPDGTDARPLRPNAGTDLDLDYAWSPDGALIAVVVQTGPREVDVDLVEAESGRVLTRIGGPGVEENPGWSPDGQWLVFTSAGDLQRVDRRGEGRIALTDDPAPDWLPRWVGAR
jgi:TolB protein